MALFLLTDDGLREVDRTTFRDANLRERHDLQRVLRESVEVIAEGVLVIAEEFSEWEDSNRRIDLLGVDPDGTLVVIELKRTEDGGFMELQALRYAAMVSAMKFERAVEVFRRHLERMGREGEDPRALLLEHLEGGEETFAVRVRIVLASMDFGKELTTTVMWLNTRELDIRCVRLRPHALDGRILLDVQQVIPLPEAAEYMVQLKEKAAEERRTVQERVAGSPFWFVNVGMDHADVPESEPRHWSHCRQWGYLLAGGGPRYSGALKRLAPGAPVFAYVKGGVGYVGFGIVRGEPVPAHQLELAGGRRLEDHLGPVFRERNRPDNEPDWEWGVPVEWRTTFPLEEGKRFPGAFAKQHVVCRLTDEPTLTFLAEEFDVDLDGFGVKTRAPRRPNLDFERMGIPAGAVLHSGSATVTVTGPRKVRLDGEEMSLTAATQRVRSIDTPIAPAPHWTNQGESLKTIYDRTYGE